jgi:predicted nucleotidyltransferase
MKQQTISDMRRSYVEDLASGLKKIVAILAKKPEVQRVILFGSYASGRRDLFTDLDILVVMDSEQEFILRSAQLLTELQSGVDVDLLVYTPEEFSQMRRSGFLNHVLSDSVVVYERE